jgi:hypothetical protein
MAEDTRRARPKPSPHQHTSSGYRSDDHLCPVFWRPEFKQLQIIRRYEPDLKLDTGMLGSFWCLNFWTLAFAGVTSIRQP